MHVVCEFILLNCVPDEVVYLHDNRNTIRLSVTKHEMEWMEMLCKAPMIAKPFGKIITQELKAIEINMNEWFGRGRC